MDEPRDESPSGHASGRLVLRIFAILGLVVFALVLWIRFQTAPERVYAPPAEPPGAPPAAPPGAPPAELRP